MPLNFANIIALPLLLGVGVAFKIYYIMAWRAGQTGLLQSSLTRAVHVQRADHRHGVRQPVAVEPSRHVEHGQAAGAVAACTTLAAAVLFQPVLMGPPREPKRLKRRVGAGPAVGATASANAGRLHEPVVAGADKST